MNLKISKYGASIILLFVLINQSCAQIPLTRASDKLVVSRLMDSLWIHPESFIKRDAPNWIRLNNHLEDIDVIQMNQIILKIFYGDNSFILNRSHAYDGVIGVLNKSSNDAKNKKYYRKIRDGFRNKETYPNNKVVLIEGDSWFEYPIFLKDITDHLEKKKDLAIFSHAHGSDWISNMISSIQYEYDFINIKPDVFIISGGGNDIVGDSRLSNFISYYPINSDSTVLTAYRKYVRSKIISQKDSIPYNRERNSRHRISNQDDDTLLINQIVAGRRYLNQNFYRFLATIKIEYKILLESLKKIDPAQFDSTKIITQGYDYAVPSFKRNFGIRMFLKNGEWLKQPLMMNGITDEYIQKAIIKTIIFEVNEMIIELGKEYHNVYHIDSRGLTAYMEKVDNKPPGRYWYDELHPKSNVFNNVAEAYYAVINDKTNNPKKVINTKEYFFNKKKKIE